MALARLYTFTAGTVIQSSQVNNELDQIVNLVNGTSTTVDALIKNNSSTVAPLTLDQLNSAGPILIGKDNSTERFRLTAKGKITIPSSHGSSIPTSNITPGGFYHADLSTVGNVGFGEDDLHTKTIDANVFGNVNDVMHIKCWGTTAANANAKEIRLYIGGFNFFTTGALTSLNNKDWQCDLFVVRQGASNVYIACRFSSSDNGSGVTVWENNTQHNVTALTFTGSLVWKITGQSTGGANDDIQQFGTLMFKYPTV